MLIAGQHQLLRLQRPQCSLQRLVLRHYHREFVHLHNFQRRYHRTSYLVSEWIWYSYTPQQILGRLL